MRLIALLVLLIFGASSVVAQSIAEAYPGLRVNGQIQLNVLAQIWGDLSPAEREAFTKEINEQMNMSGAEVQSARDLLDQRLQEMTENNGGAVVRPPTLDETIYCPSNPTTVSIATMACGVLTANRGAFPVWKPATYDCNQVVRYGTCSQVCEYQRCN
jgi:hypothetical protein